MPSYTRRQFSALALSALPTAGLLSTACPLFAAGTKPDSKVAGVQIGLNVPYSFGNVGMGGDEVLALRQFEIEVANEIDHIADGIEVANIYEGKLAAAINEVDVHPQLAAGLVVQFDDVGITEKILAFEHAVIRENRRSNINGGHGECGRDDSPKR